MQKQIVFIVGMHRSGTSMLSELVSTLGVYLGEKDALFDANYGNVFGHFEHKEAVEIDHRIFKTFGGDWIMPPKVHAGWENSPKLNSVKNDIRNLLKRLTEKQMLVGIKVPNLCYTLPLWVSIASELNIATKHIFIFRNPYEVAASLKSRNNLPEEKTLDYWLRYNAQAMDFIKNKEHLICHYNELLQDPLPAIARIAQFLKLDVPAEKFVAAKVIVFPEIKHNNAEKLSKVATDGAVEEEYSNLINLVALQNRGMKIEIPKVSEQDELRAANKILKARIKIMDETIKAMQKEFQEKYEQQDQMTKERYATINNMDKMIAERDQRINQLEKLVAEKNLELTKLHKNFFIRIFRKIGIQ